MPRVSICIPSYKPAHFELCLASAIAQTYQDIEIIVSDDCPTDAIERICEKFPGRVQYSRNPHRNGGQSNLLRLMELANGEFIKFIFDDDLLHPFCIQHLLEALEASKAHNTRLAFSLRDTIDENNKILGHLNLLKLSGEIKVLPGGECIRLMTSNAQNFIGEFTTVLFRREDCFDAQGQNHLFQLGGEIIHGLDDVSAFINLAAVGNVVAHPATLSYFRQHSGSNTAATGNPSFLYAITDWEIIVNHARSAGYLKGDSEKQAFNSLLREYRYWVSKFPQLQSDITRFEQHLMDIVA